MYRLLLSIALVFAAAPPVAGADGPTKARHLVGVRGAGTANVVARYCDQAVNAQRCARRQTQNAPAKGGVAPSPTAQTKVNGQKPNGGRKNGS